ncbi:PREDICTED: tRNA-splicing endonuclease subunit Sen54-like [Amphimedon queenslandica]|uniref:tRNA-splicing endonuclease subunit Sen54 N-terminal domain-containing protein n=1 Tax=Amphimedon queenslandica TaxID=400682 RepID=A0A1X7VEY4_AMPQE|nr:PREDICTED: tRNA-splicing endonuclease subunit Sen54-like [Amphimedon queenslandica]|eukprot:XP_019849263.1 PREDICTED: tRNA-splicing endonuclease subunit Sen54-like [Amphimedon queenslandica]
MASGENETHLVFNLEGALPAKMGQKSLNVGGTKDEEERLSSFLTGYQFLLSKERQTSKRNVSVAEYCSQESGKLLLKVKKGGHWNYYGHTEKSQTYLYPEEALYLQECGVMEIVSTGGGPWTIQKAYHTFLRGNKSQLQYYQVYADLKRSGYIVQRPTVNPSESQIPHLLLVYKPQKSFKKTSPGPPDTVITVTSPHECFPLPSTVRELRDRYPNSQVQYSIVNGKDITYYSIYHLDALRLT